jgi:hypothetical protein
MTFIGTATSPQVMQLVVWSQTGAEGAKADAALAIIRLIR